MAAARYSTDVLKMFYGPIPEEENRNLPQPLEPDQVVLYDSSIVFQNNLDHFSFLGNRGRIPITEYKLSFDHRCFLIEDDCIRARVWRMAVSEENPNNKDLLVFARKNKEKFTDLVENEIQKLKSVKVSFGLQIEFSIERDGETQYMEHYFRENEPHVFNRNDENQIKIEFDRFIERTKGEIEAWSERGSGWVLERIMVAYMNVARYQPCAEEPIYLFQPIWQKRRQ